MKQTYYAHIRCDQSGNHYQTLAEHNRATAGYAQDALSEISLGNCAYLAGLIHDAGKATQVYQCYLNEAVFKGDAVRGSVNHTFAGVQFLLKRYHDSEKWGEYAPLTAELLAYAAGSHHGLFDCIDENSQSGFQHRLGKEDINYDEAITGFVDQCASLQELGRRFAQSIPEMEAFISRFVPLLKETSSEDSLFFLGLTARLLTSSVIEGDRRDTAEFMENIHFPSFFTKQSCRSFWSALSSQVDNRLDSLPTDTPIAAARQTISRACRSFAGQPCGIYRLNIPTGSGKTLSSLRFSLAHAAQWEKKRIIFTSPLLSILEQNADVIRDYICNDTIILEHHSNIVNSSAHEEELDLTDLMTSNWDAPIIITTLVQFLNTIFDGKGSCIRRFHALCNSIIVIDEVQTVPVHLLSLFNLAISFLASACNATVILCSATQPCSEAADHPITGNLKEMIPYDAALWRTFKRTFLQDAGSLSLSEISQFTENALTDADSLLIVCNKKSEAEFLYQALPETYDKYHLSASMCVAHRRLVLSELQKALLKRETVKKIVCISTQVIEAGVDISFSCVIRLTAGMDNAVQSAGRCNRNGESKKCAPVYLVQCVGENLSHLPDIEHEKAATMSLLAEYRRHPMQFNCDLCSDVSIRYYYRQLYQKEMPHGLQDGPAVINGKKTSLFAMLSDNRHFADCSICKYINNFCLLQAFKTAGRYFTVYDTDTIDVLVPYEEGKNLITQFNSLLLPRDFAQMLDLLDQAKPFTISLYTWQYQHLMKESAVIPLCGGRILALQDGYYHCDLGLRMEREKMNFMEV